MNKLVIVIAMLACACGTKQNPRACCTDAADCMNVGLPVGTVCDEGLLCRGNRCVEDPCSSSAECDVTAPYCVQTDEGRCAEACSADSQCPGFGQTADQTFCAGGACVECRIGMNDCPANAPICSSTGSCVACALHTDCGSGVCAEGACADENRIAYVTTNGAPGSDCSRSSPCNSVGRALDVLPAKRFVLIDAGTYTSTNTIAVSGQRTLIGRGNARPVLTRSNDGPIVAVSGGEAKLEYLELFGARGTVSAETGGSGLRCAFGAPNVTLEDVSLRMNAYAGISAAGCSLTVKRSTLEGNGGDGAQLIDSNALFDQCLVVGNGGGGIKLDDGLFQVRNTIIARNRFGIDMYSAGNGNQVSYSTIVDNGPDSVGGFQCNQDGGTGTFDNNIYARNLPVQTAGPCDFANSITDSAVDALKFVRPDSAPYDYHIQAGSSAIDIGGVTPFKYDIDGQPRPGGAGFDIGADEYHP